MGCNSETESESALDPEPDWFPRSGINKKISVGSGPSLITDPTFPDFLRPDYLSGLSAKRNPEPGLLPQDKISIRNRKRTGRFHVAEGGWGGSRPGDLIHVIRNQREKIPTR